MKSEIKLSREEERAGSVGKGDDMKRRKAYVQSTTACPVCGRIAVMRMFKCRCEDWYGYYAIRFYCKNKKCPVDHVCTEFFPDSESAEKQMEKYIVKERRRKKCKK
ncbi:MAG: hypothetical protein IJG84_11415 [Kiritimatiellae bacterium]|nr:hypothetical protein [Kiritimatiellia bacterium]